MKSPSVSTVALSLERCSVAWASIEAVVALAAGTVAGSVALVAFGADSVVELLSSLVVLARLRLLIESKAASPAREHRDHRLLAVFFYALAAYVTTSAVVALLRHDHPAKNPWGLAICLGAVVVMASLTGTKKKLAAKFALGGHASLARLVRADAAESALCAWLSASTLVGVVLAAWLHWWWADPVSGLVIVIFALREGREEWICDAEVASPVTS